MQYLGSKEILNNHKTGFLCSRKIPADIILKTYDWAIEQRGNGKCIISGFHSVIEKDVFHFLLKGTQPIIMVLARGMKKRWDDNLIKEIDKGRLLIISNFNEKVTRPTIETTMERNKLILELADEMYIPFVLPGGNLEKAIHEFQNKF